MMPILAPIHPPTEPNSVAPNREINLGLKMAFLSCFST